MLYSYALLLCQLLKATILHLYLDKNSFSSLLASRQNIHRYGTCHLIKSHILYNTVNASYISHHSPSALHQSVKYRYIRTDMPLALPSHIKGTFCISSLTPNAPPLYCIVICITLHAGISKVRRLSSTVISVNSCSLTRSGSSNVFFACISSDRICAVTPFIVPFAS